MRGRMRERKKRDNGMWTEPVARIFMLDRITNKQQDCDVKDIIIKICDSIIDDGDNSDSVF